MLYQGNELNVKKIISKVSKQFIRMKVIIKMIKSIFWKQ